MEPREAATQPTSAESLRLVVNGDEVLVPDRGDTLLGVLRDELGLRGAKDGCSPQGQCGCCTVLVDGAPRVACVTPARRVAGRSVTTVEGLPQDRRTKWANALCSTGGSQCGFCTPGIVVRLEALKVKTPDASDAAVEQALLAHLCRCTGWQTITEAFQQLEIAEPPSAERLALASQRAALEGGVAQHVSPESALGEAGFAADSAPMDALIAVPAADGGWAVGETLHEARANAAKVQGRRTTVGHGWPVNVPDAGEQASWDSTLRTTWVEPGYLETDASWCEPGGEPVGPLANGGAFGAKVDSPAPEVARQLAEQLGRTVLVLASREDSVMWGAKRPPVGAGVRADGTGVIHVARTAGIAEAIESVAPGLVVVEHDVAGPRTSSSIRAAGWAEALLLLSGLESWPGAVISPNGAVATAVVTADRIVVKVECGQILDEVMLRSYCIGAAHMGWSWITSEALTLDDRGQPQDLTVRSFGIARAVDMPLVEVELRASESEPINGSDAVFAAVAAETRRFLGNPQDVPAT